MGKVLHLTDENWSYGSYHRIHYKKDMLYTFFQYVDIHFIWNVGMGTFSLQDRLAEELLSREWISRDRFACYHQAALAFLSQMEAYDTWPIEDLYGRIRQIRRELLGTKVLEQYALCRMEEACEFDAASGIDQSAKKDAILREKKAVILALCQPEYAALMKRDAEKALACGCQVYALVQEEAGSGLPTEKMLESVLGDGVIDLPVTMQEGKTQIPMDSHPDIQRDADADQLALFVYGEEGLLHCRHLAVDTIVQAVPYGFHARAMLGQLDGGRASVVYVPKYFDITQWVGMTEKTKLSYWQLWQLWKDHGDPIYDKTVEQLYQTYPQYFLNIYDNGRACAEAAADYPIQVDDTAQVDSKSAQAVGQDPPAPSQDPSGIYYGLRDQAIADYIRKQPGMTYLSTYFTKDLEPCQIPWQGEEQQTGILVHGVRMAAAEKARVMKCDTAKTLRQQLAGESKGVQFLSNFLFFMTPKLAELYNTLREDRPREQLREKQGHLDYQMYWQDGHRVESFPLYEKAVLAKKKDGRFLLCQFALGGGRAKIARDQGVEVLLSWDASAVNAMSENAASSELSVLVYTPYLSLGDEGEGMFANSYRRLVGEDRLNLVIIQDQIHCIRQGDVVLPSIGVVVSLSKVAGQQLLKTLGLELDDQGYADASSLHLTVQLDGPKQIPADEWQQVEWAYGGGLTLMTDGQSIYGADRREEMDEATGTACLMKEGWLSPLSRQTQESALHVLAKHPRTAMGITKSGDLFVLVFSGRTRMSAGADYQEMCHIAKVLIPDVDTMMNVDGGGSSVLGLALDGHFMELSYPATSMSSTAGMVRKVNTVLCLEV